jgi:hypothetical protein
MTITEADRATARRVIRRHVGVPKHVLIQTPRRSGPYPQGSGLSA